MKKIISTEITEANIAQAIGLLSDTPRKLEALYARFSDEKFTKPLGKGERSATETVAHLLHCEAIASEFICLALLKNNVTVIDVHPEREFGKLARYDMFSFKALLEYFNFRRTAMLRMLTPLTLTQWARALSAKGKTRSESVYWRARSMSLHEMEHLVEIENKLVKETP
jgi:hypothetical protein